MRKLFTVLVMVVATLPLFGQQEAQYTQFMFNKIAFNPAYAGSHEAPCFSGIYRTQWTKLEGAPVSQNFSFHTPLFGKRVGFGINVHHDKIGPTNSWNYGMMYAYRMPAGKGHFSIGIQGLIRSYRINWAEITSVHSGDILYGTDEESKIVPNFGAGVYYSNDLFYAGLAVPRLLGGDLTFGYDGLIDNTDYSQERQHAYMMAGIKLPLSDNVGFKPATLVKYSVNAPLDIDLHGSLIFFDKFSLGATYRLGGLANSFGESIDFVFQVLLDKRIKLGLAYDYTLSEVRNFHSGSYEIMLEYCLISKQKGATNPRFF